MVDVKILKSLAQDIKVLYVEDENYLRESVALYLNKIFSSVDIAVDGLEGLHQYHEQDYDLVITDIHMPNMNGLEMLEGIKTFKEEQEVIIVSAYSDTSYFIDAIRLGVNGYIIKPIDYAQMNETLFKSVSKLVAFKENENYKTHLSELVELRTKALIELEADKVHNYEQTLYAFIEMIEDRDTYTGGHSQRVAHYSKLIAQAMEYSEKNCERVYRAGILHDIGKIATPDTVLLKPGSLSGLEYKLIQEHVTVSYDLLCKIPMYHELAEIVFCHHERYDGKGYPNGLKDNEIPPLAQVMIVADAFDAMTTNRIYKGRMDVDTAVAELVALSGQQFHPKVVQVAQKVLSEIDLPDTTGQVPITELERERFAYYYNDQVTDAFNTDYLDFVLNKNTYSKEFHCITMLYLHNFSQYNQQNSWSEGNQLLQSLVTFLYQQYPDAMIFRIHGDDFVILNHEHHEINMNHLDELEIFQNNRVGVSKQHFDLREQPIENLEMLEVLL